MDFKKLAFRNLRRSPGRTAALVVLVALLSFTLFGGAATVFSLRTGMKSLEGRMGADVIVYPSTAKSKVDLDQILLQGTTGYFYMNKSYLEDLRAFDGVEKAAAQTFLASLKADCCSVAVQVIGFDPEEDFTVQPWISQSYAKKLEDYDVIVGCKVSAGIGEDIRIYKQNCRVVARLEATGTDMDTAVYTTQETMAMLLQAARDQGHDLKITGDSADVISAVYIKVSGDTTAEAVANDINIHTRKIEAVETRSMITGISDSMSGISSALTALIAAVWILILLIIVVAFIIITRERRREFAMLRMIGASGRMLSGMILKETTALCLAGGAIGAGLAAMAAVGFSGLIEQTLGLPFLLPSAVALGLLGAASLAGALVTGLLASVWSVIHISRIQTSTILREEN